MRSAGCVINDYADRHVVPHVTRTRARPLAAGRVTPRGALWLFAVLCLAAFALVLTMDMLAILMSFGAVALAALYRFIKRDTQLPLVVLGMGKSGHIGSKIAATLASTGSPAFFVHPGEASHGDLGMITVKDVVLAFSNSGETEEILTILPLIKRLGVPLVALTGNPGSTLARLADAHINVSVAQEACPLDLAPTASTTAALAMGDALAIALLEARGFT